MTNHKLATTAGKNWRKHVEAGDEVSYSDVCFWGRMHGKLLRFEHGKYGADCVVDWGTGRESPECAFNLISWHKETVLTGGGK